MKITSHLPTPDQAVEVAGLQFASPIGLAAGLDKDGEALPLGNRLDLGLLKWAP